MTTSSYLPFSFLKENTVFLIATAILKYYYLYFLDMLRGRAEGVDCIGLTLGPVAQTVNISLPAQEFTNIKLDFVASNGTRKDLNAKKGITIKKNVVSKGAYALDGFELKNVPDYLYFTAVGGSVSIGMNKNGTVETIEFEYTKDPESGVWTDFIANGKLLTSPKILVTDVAEHCFDRMFASCSTLQEPPMLLPALKLADDCYT